MQYSEQCAGYLIVLFGSFACMLNVYSKYASYVYKSTSMLK